MQTLEKNQVNQDAVDFVKYGYGDLHGLKTRSLDFRTESFENYETFAAALAMVPGYNEFDGPKVAMAFKSLWPKLMSVQFGREGSPVLYVKVPYWTHQAHGAYPGGGTKLSEDDVKALQAEVKVVGQALQADENSVDKLTGAVRLWWD